LGRDLMSRWLLCALVLLMGCIATNADAATITHQSAALTPLLPARGAYYDSSKSGTGVSVDVGLDGFVFLTYYGYNAAMRVTSSSRCEVQEQSSLSHPRRY
jgi:hypothetical protein